MKDGEKKVDREKRAQRCSDVAPSRNHHREWYPANKWSMSSTVVYYKTTMVFMYNQELDNEMRTDVVPTSLFERGEAVRESPPQPRSPDAPLFRRLTRSEKQGDVIDTLFLDSKIILLLQLIALLPQLLDHLLTTNFHAPVMHVLEANHTLNLLVR